MNEQWLHLIASALFATAASASSTPAPTPSGTTKFDPTDEVTRFHSLPRIYGGNTFELDTSGMSDYVLGTLMLAGLPLAFFLIFIVLYFNFLCIRSGCCSCCCNAFKCWRGFLKCCCICGGRYAVDTCCPLADKGAETTVEVKGMLSCCLCRKHNTACCHNGCPGTRDDKKAVEARFIAILAFIGLICLQIGPFWGLAALNDAVGEVADGLGDLSDTFSNLETQFETIEADGVSINAKALSLGDSCTYDAAKSIASSLATSGTAIAASGDTLQTLLGSTASLLNRWSETVEERGTAFLQYYDEDSSMGVTYGAFFFLGVLYSVSGLLGALCCETKSHLCRFATGCLALSSWVGILILLILTITISLELLIGVFLSDMCYDGPVAGIMQYANKTLDGTMTGILDYYMRCEGGNPFTAEIEVSKSTVSSAASTLSSNSALMTYDPTCTQTYYDDITTILSDMPSSSDPVGVLTKVADGVGCWEIEPAFSKFLKNALCTHTVSGFYFLFGSHASMMVYIYICMIITSFLRQGMAGANICYHYHFCSHPDKHKDHEFAKDDEDEELNKVESHHEIELQNNKASTFSEVSSENQI